MNDVYFLDCGKLVVDHGSMTAGYKMGVEQIIPVIPVLIKTKNNYILFDTGLDDRGLDEPDTIWGVKKHVVHEFERNNSIVHQLDKFNVSKDEVSIVINSHLHWDHCGGNRHFTDAQFYVQKSEYRFAHYPDDFEEALYKKSHFDHGVDYKLLEGDYKVDESVHLIFTPGHSVGHQSLLIEDTEYGNFILVGDAFYSIEAEKRMLPPGLTHDASRAVESMHLLKNLAIRHNAKLVMTHEPKFWSEYKEIVSNVK